MKYTVSILPSALKSLKKIDQKFAKKINERICLLADDPRHNGSLKLSGETNSYRTRVGKYRIIYEIFDTQVLVMVVNIDHRKDIYK